MQCPRCEISRDEQLHQHKQQSHSAEFSISQKLLGGDKKLLEQKDKHSSLVRELSIPCIVKQPKQPEFKGVIRKDEGDRFLVEVDSKEISVSKLFVYPDLNKTVEQIPPTKQVAPPSKTRRKKGDGTGYVYRRTVARKGKQLFNLLHCNLNSLFRTNNQRQLFSSGQSRVKEKVMKQTFYYLN